jgi:uncharacterized protein YerC
MTQISKYPLTKEVKEELFAIFWNSISELRTASATSAFFSDLLTDTEEIMLVKRFAVALLLFQGKKPIEIISLIHVSFSTVRGVSSWLHRANPQTIRLLEIIEKKQSWQVIIDAFDTTIDKLPLRRGTNWSRIGKEKWQRAKGRNARSLFRK